jgi:hypothetical protein
MRLAVLSSFLLAGCGSAPVATVAAATTPPYNVTCPANTSLVQDTVCEETTPHAATTQALAAQFCIDEVMHLCSAADLVGQFAKTPQMVSGVQYWLSDVEGPDGFTIENTNPFPITVGSFQYFCCTTGAVSL